MVEKKLVRRTQSSNYNHKPNSHLPPISTPSQQANSGIYNRGVPKNCSASNFKSVLTFKMGHKANECNKPLLSKGRALILDDVVEVEEVGDSDSDELVRGDDEKEGVVLVMKKTLLTPRKEDDDKRLRGNIFRSTCSILGKVCELVIDGGSCENAVS